MHDVIIVGGGLAGLYTALSLPPSSRILLLESEGHLGGRVYTVSAKGGFPAVEAGAARFNRGHKRLWRLLRRYGLAEKAVKISNASKFLSSEPERPVLKEVLAAARRKTRAELMQRSILDLASPGDAAYLEASFGYSSELTIMNAWDALHLFAQYDRPFWVLAGGLSQLIERLRAEVLKRGVEIKYDAKVVDVEDSAEGCLVRTKAGEELRARACVLALPRPELERLPRFKTLLPLLAHIKTSPLCRIYSRTDRDVPGTKFTTDSDLRMIIPVGPRALLSSYTDGKYAKRWKAVHDRGGIEAVDRKLNKHYKELGLDYGLQPDHKFFYWDHGVGYWGVGADSRHVATALRNPGRNLYVCGEHYSVNHQQWMEGALETAEWVAARLAKPATRRAGVRRSSTRKNKTH